VTYGKRTVVDRISFDVREGEVFALLGPNGAGKTTTVEVLEGLRPRAGGDVEVLGCDPQRHDRAIRDRVGIVLQEAGLDGELTVHEVVRFFAGLYPAPRDVSELLELVQLGTARRARVRTLSGGQRRRLDLALGLVGDPALLFLDEPTTGFDPAARRNAWSLLRDLRGLGKTIVLTSHYMDEVQHLADRVVVMMAGRVLAEGPPSSLGGRDLAQARIRFRVPTEADVRRLPEGIAATATVDGTEVTVDSDTPTRVLAILSHWALARDHELEALTVTRPSLEDVLLTLTDPSQDQAP
jgi:ABC-2 type transport system ATP-binding protein